MHHISYYIVSRYNIYVVQYYRVEPQDYSIGYMPYHKVASCR